MDQHKVKILLNLETFPPLDILEEILEEEIFHLRDYFLRNPVVAPLFMSRVRKLNQFEEIKAEFLRGNDDLRPIPNLEFQKASTLEELFSILEQTFVKLRGEMSRGLEPKIIATLAEKMVEVQEEYERKFLGLVENTIQNKPLAGQVKAADQISTGRALHLIKSNSTDELAPILEKEFNRIRGLKRKV